MKEVTTTRVAAARRAVRDGEIRLDTPRGPRRYRVDAGGKAIGSGKGCSVDMYLLAPALGKPIHAEATCPATSLARSAADPKGRQ